MFFVMDGTASIEYPQASEQQPADSNDGGLLSAIDEGSSNLFPMRDQVSPNPSAPKSAINRPMYYLMFHEPISQEVI